MTGILWPRAPGSNVKSMLEQALDGEWRTALELADIAGIDRRGAGQRLRPFVRMGFAEERDRVSPRVHDRVRVYRRNPAWGRPPA